MTGVEMLGVAGCVVGSAVLIRFLAWLCRPVPFHDLTRPSWYVDQVTGRFDNDAAAAHHRKQRDAIGLGGCRAVPARVLIPKPEPAQLFGWEDDGGAIA